MLKTALERDLEARPYERNIRAFGEALVGSPELLERLDQTPDRESFIETYLEMADQHGQKFTREELLVAVQEQKMGSNWVLPKAVLMMIRDRF